MSQKPDVWFTQKLQPIVDEVAISLRSTRVGGFLSKVWIYQERVAVFDFIVNDQTIAFDFSSVNPDNLRIEVFDRRGNIDLLAKILEIKSLGNLRLIVNEFPSFSRVEDLGRQITQLIVSIIDKLSNTNELSADNYLLKCLGEVAPLVIVDVGANDITDPPYSKLRRVGLCKIIGFEPQKEAFKDLQNKQFNDAEYLPFAIGAPGEISLNIYHYSGFTSAYFIDESTIGLVPNWYSGTRLHQRIVMNCIALDAVPGLSDFDLLKIDIQGGEINVFRYATRSLSTALCVITEVSFFPLYQNAPSFADVHMELTAKGFFLHKFLHQTSISVTNTHNTDASNLAGASQLLDGDAVYIRDYRNMETLSTLDIQKLAALSHFVFGSKDLTLRMLGELLRRNETSTNDVNDYIAYAL